MRKLAQPIRRAFISVLGLLLLLLGAVLTVAPGPGLLIVAAGLAVLAREYEWARRIHEQLKNTIKRSAQALRPHHDDHHPDR